MRQVGIQQVHRASPHVCAPGLEGDGVHADFHRTGQRFATGIEHRLDGQISWIEQRIIIDLPVLMIDLLLEIALAVEQAHSHKPQAEIAGRFGMIAGQNAQAAGRNGQSFMEAKFSGKIRNRILQQGRGVGLAPGCLFSHVGLERCQHALDALGKVRVLQTDAQFVIGYFVQDGHGIVVKVLPAAWREFLKNFLRFLAPGPPEVSREAIEAHN